MTTIDFDAWTHTQLRRSTQRRVSRILAGQPVPELAQITGRQRAVLDCLRTIQPVTASDLAHALGIAYTSSWRHLRRLEQRGLVVSYAGDQRAYLWKTKDPEPRGD